MKKTGILSVLAAALFAAAPLQAQDNTAEGYVWPDDPAVLENLDA